VPEDRQGATLGVAQGFGSLARIFGPLCGTWLFGALQPDAPYVFAAIVLGLVWLAALWRLRRVTAPVIEPTA
jgi:hypothetical protein